MTTSVGGGGGIGNTQGGPGSQGSDSGSMTTSVGGGGGGIGNTQGGPGSQGSDSGSMTTSVGGGGYRKHTGRPRVTGI